MERSVWHYFLFVPTCGDIVCPQIWRDVYMIVITILTVSTLWFQLHPHFFTSHWYYTRMAVYVGLAGYGVMPSIHWVYLNGLSSKIVQVKYMRVRRYVITSLPVTCFKKRKCIRKKKIYNNKLSVVLKVSKIYIGIKNK